MSILIRLTAKNFRGEHGFRKRDTLYIYICISLIPICIAYVCFMAQFVEWKYNRRNGLNSNVETQYQHSYVKRYSCATLRSCGNEIHGTSVASRLNIVPWSNSCRFLI